MSQPNAKRAPTPMRTAAPLAPRDAMAASQQGHIENLVQKSRNLEHTIKKLNDELSLEQTRTKDTVNTLNAVRQQWRAEQKEWHAGCDALQACHTIAHLRTACSLDDERIAVLKEREIARRERLARIQRDYKITMFQAREAELESQIEDLQADLDSRAAQTESFLKSRDQKYQKTILDLRTREATLSSELKLKSDEIVAAHKQREDIEDELRRLREAQADADATTVTNVSKLSRITVQRDGLQARVTQLERELEDLKDNNAKLQRQLDNWQGLKKGDDADIEILRKKNVELEVQLREANALTQERDKALEKEKGRTAKLKEVLHEWKSEAGEQDTLRKQAVDEATDAKKAAEKLEQEISDLRAQLTAALKTSAAPKSNTTPAIPLAPEDEADQTRPKPKPKSKPKPAKRSKSVDSDLELIELSAKAKGKRKAPRDDSADERPAAEKPKPARAKKVASTSNEKAPKKRTLESEAKNQKKAAESLQTKASKSAVVADSAAEDDQDPAPKKKKRKLNVGIFPSTQQHPPVFHWDQGEIGLGIPTELSPVKDAPRRLHPSSTGPSFAKTRG
ncbi:uncharacterized protein EDB93DRAFT_1227569 [Suillus bovinus]|uniref:uncharacterized protein n=1 Tax=Suillus bovinus TaxID=48563 RepID=UPI001B86A66F|nr:uncharacterized protein EDB93DRAFT_1227569 [Suillus bovinus]KAG2146185.1 hypothetical protein EDB93DRAFT_1227569 [Suillus bovinus]